MAGEKDKSVIVCGGALNRNGYRILVDGIQLDSFKKNPIMLYVHARDDKWSKQYKGNDAEKLNLPIGRWENIRVENGQLLADPVFDVEDEFGKEVARKWEKGFLNACSMGFNFIEWSEDPTVLLQGQTRPTVTKSELLEISIVDIPGDADAVRLTLSANPDPLSILPLLNKKEKTKPDMELKDIALTLGLPATASETEVNAKIASLKSMQVEGVLSLGREKGVVNDTNLAAMRTMVEQNPEFARLSWESLPTPQAQVTPEAAKQPQQSLAATLTAAAQGGAVSVPDDRKNWDLKKWRQNDPDGLLALSDMNQAEFERIAQTGIKTGLAVNFRTEKQVFGY